MSTNVATYYVNVSVYNRVYQCVAAYVFRAMGAVCSVHELPECYQCIVNDVCIYVLRIHIVNEELHTHKERIHIVNEELHTHKEYIFIGFNYHPHIYSTTVVTGVQTYPFQETKFGMGI